MPRPRLSGALIVDQRRSLIELLGDQAYAEALARVPADARQCYESALGVSWIPVDVVEQVVSAAAEVVGKPVLELHGDLTRRNMARTLNGIWKVLLRVTTDSALVSRTPILWRKSFDTGVLDSQIVAKGRAVITLRRWPDISDIHLVGVQVGIEQVLIAAGRKDAQSFRRRTLDGAVIEATWSA